MSNNEQMRPLNTNDGWESIVNTNATQRSSARERVAARKKERKIRKLLIETCAMSAAGIASVVLGIVGAVASWLTTAVAFVCLLVSSHLLGRYVEVKR